MSRSADLAADPQGNPVLPARELYRTFVPFLRTQWKGYVLAGALTLLGTAVALLMPWPLKYLFDEVLVPVRGQTAPDVQNVLVLIVVALAVVTIADSLVQLLRSYVLTVVGERVSTSIRNGLYTHLQKLSLNYHEKVPTGEFTTRLTGDVDKVRGFLTDKVIQSSSSVLTLVGMAGVLFVLDWQLSVGLVLVMPLLVFVVARFRERVKAVENASRDIEGDVAATAQESLIAIKLIKSMGRESHDAEQFAGKSTASMHSILHVARTTTSLTWALDFLVAVATAALVWLGAQRVISGALTPGDLVIFTAYLRDFFGPTRNLAKLPAQYTKAAVRGSRIAEVFHHEPEIVDQPGALKAGPPVRDLMLEGVDFSYGPERLVLKGIDIVVPVGRTLAIVGPTGAGKSTIASLLCRLQDPTSGRVLMDGLDLRDLTTDSVHQQVGLVLQDAMLFRASVADNIAYGRPDAPRVEIEQAARLAQAHDFVSKLPEGYDTVLTERGVTLSGGQRQRLALARTVLSGNPVLVLDEPTTGLDARSETGVLSALRRVSEGRTTVVITHRMAAAMTADEIIVLDEGVIVESGTHETLLASDGLYAEMCHLQKIGNGVRRRSLTVPASSDGQPPSSDQGPPTADGRPRPSLQGPPASDGRHRSPDQGGEPLAERLRSVQVRWVIRG
ncbi:MAG: ABC transporter ATP-binding protein [Aeromicrobium sp.]